jgi:hypothetical protein
MDDAPVGCLPQGASSRDEPHGPYPPARGTSFVPTAGDAPAGGNEVTTQGAPLAASRRVVVVHLLISRPSDPGVLLEIGCGYVRIKQRTARTLLELVTHRSRRRRRSEERRPGRSTPWSRFGASFASTQGSRRGCRFTAATDQRSCHLFLPGLSQARSPVHMSVPTGGLVASQRAVGWGIVGSCRLPAPFRKRRATARVVSVAVRV